MNTLEKWAELTRRSLVFGDLFCQQMSEVCIDI